MSYFMLKPQATLCCNNHSVSSTKKPKCFVRPLASLVCALIQRYVYQAFKS